MAWWGSQRHWLPPPYIYQTAFHITEIITSTLYLQFTYKLQHTLRFGVKLVEDVSIKPFVTMSAMEEHCRICAKVFSIAESFRVAWPLVATPKSKWKHLHICVGRTWWANHKANRRRRSCIVVVPIDCTNRVTNCLKYLIKMIWRKNLTPFASMFQYFSRRSRCGRQASKMSTILYDNEFATIFYNYFIVSIIL